MHKKWSFPLGISSVNVNKPQFLEVMEKDWWHEIDYKSKNSRISAK